MPLTLMLSCNFINMLVFVLSLSLSLSLITVFFVMSLSLMLCHFVFSNVYVLYTC
jgi:hypothetical protein